jgi:small subunit ribosomal protein S9
MVKIKEQKSKDCRAVGRRKCASARVRLDKGTGKITINGKILNEYLPYFEWQNIVAAPLKALAKEKDYDITVKIVGGGKKSQATAIQHGIARALVAWNEEFRKTLKVLGFLTRDPRVKERKKFGLKKARRAPQWSKR